MSGVTKAQKARLGAFLLVSTALLVGTLAVLVGSSIFARHDTYTLVIEGSISGLEKGAQVRYNGIRVGRVETLEIAPDNPSAVLITLNLYQGTPVTEDTLAVVNMQGITGLKYIELTGGTADSVVLEPGSEIPSGGSDMDLLTEKAFGIATKIEKLLDNLVTITGGENVEKVTAVLTEAELTLRSVRHVVDNGSEKFDGILGQTQKSMTELDGILVETRLLLGVTSTAIDRIGKWVDPRELARLMDNIDRTVDEIHARVSKEELGATIAAATVLSQESTKLIKDADVTLLRTRDDLRRSMDDLATSTENLAEFTQILVDNPSVLISGRGERDRALP